MTEQLTGHNKHNGEGRAGSWGHYWGPQSPRGPCSQEDFVQTLLWGLAPARSWENRDNDTEMGLQPDKF